jgi:hypothetical protein
MITEHTYIVRFCVHDHYSITLTAPSEDDAIEKAQEIFDDDGEQAFEFDITQGGSCDWHAEEVRP